MGATARPLSQTVDPATSGRKPGLRGGAGGTLSFRTGAGCDLNGRMSPTLVGQRCVSGREPELGLGLVAGVDRNRVTISFPATGETRIYAANTPVLERVRFAAGESVASRDGAAFTIESVEEVDGLLVYSCGGRRVREDEISDVTSVGLPQERLMAGRVDTSGVFALRQRALRARWRSRQSEVRGLLGGRLDLIPHQLYVVHEVASRQTPRVLLADEVGLGKTIEACLILQRLLAVGRARRVLILVPESLVHQWFVELLRRFNLWFSIFDEERCAAASAGEPPSNPFLSEQLVLCSVDFLAGSGTRGDQAVEAGWDVVVIDEAHHLEWTPETTSPHYALAERLARKSPGLLLLTATPTQLGLPGHFARLRLLDPDRYDDYASFVAEAEGFGAVAEIAAKVVDARPLTVDDRAALARIFDKDTEGLAGHLAALETGAAAARAALIRSLLDQHGTGRVMFRNTRAAMTGFPKRRLVPVEVAGADPALLARGARELEAEETGAGSAIRHTFKDDPRIDWLAEFLRAEPGRKVLAICRSQRKAEAIKAALLERINASVGVFHEGLPLVQRDRQAAWFAEPEGAQLLVCSEIGSEGRNFQFAHHLVLFDLPLNPGLLEQRIGRLDRIGQTETIRIHVPHFPGGAEACVLDWYHRGLDAFETPLHGGAEYQAAFRERLLVLATAAGADAGRTTAAAREAAARHAAARETLVAETAAFRAALSEKLRRGRDRLLELNSFDADVARRVIERIREEDANPALRDLLDDILEHFGVRVARHETGEVHLDPAHAFVEAYPSLPRDGMLATWDRPRAIAREDIAFLSADHPLVRDSFDLLLDSPAGTTAFAFLEADDPNIVLETSFVLEAVADAKWHVERFLAPTPVRVVVDLRGRDRTDDHDEDELARDLVDADIHRFLERPGFNAAVLKAMLEGSTELAEARSRAVKDAARARAREALGAELQRLVDLRRINDHVRDDEVQLAREQVKRVAAAIDGARLRVDALRLIVEGPSGSL